MKGFIAIDGGGSKSELVLFDELGRIFLHDIISCSNPNDIGMDNAFVKLDKSIKKMMQCGNDNNLTLHAIVLNIAGIEFGDSKKVLKEKLIASLNFENIIVDGDLASVKELGLGNDENGVVIISGTGFNMAIKKNNVFSNVGGWGYLADDYLSGFDLGKDALISCSRAIDKVDEDTILVDLLQEHFKNDLWYDMAQIYNEGVKGVASLSKFVVDAYYKKDSVAKRIIDSRVEKLAKSIKQKTKGMVTPIKVSLFGGIFEHNYFIVEKLKQILGKKYFLNVSDKKTIYGAVAIARKTMNSIDDDFYNTFNKEYKEKIK